MFLVWGTYPEKKDLGIVEQTCPQCKKKANFLFFKIVKTTKIFWIIPIWQSHDYYFTCGSCHSTFEMKKEKGTELEEKINEQKELKNK